MAIMGRYLVTREPRSSKKPLLFLLPYHVQGTRHPFHDCQEFFLLLACLLACLPAWQPGLLAHAGGNLLSLSCGTVVLLHSFIRVCLSERLRWSLIRMQAANEDFWTALQLSCPTDGPQGQVRPACASLGHVLCIIVLMQYSSAYTALCCMWCVFYVPDMLCSSLDESTWHAVA